MNESTNVATSAVELIWQRTQGRLTSTRAWIDVFSLEVTLLIFMHYCIILMAIGASPNMLWKSSTYFCVGLHLVTPFIPLMVIGRSAATTLCESRTENIG